MKRLLFTNWHIMRWARLIIALFLFLQAYLLKEWMFIGFGLFFFVQVIFNFGCGANGCTIPNPKIKRNE